jgi:hypothetical protein
MMVPAPTKRSALHQTPERHQHIHIELEGGKRLEIGANVTPISKRHRWGMPWVDLQMAR